MIDILLHKLSSYDLVKIVLKYLPSHANSMKLLTQFTSYFLDCYNNHEQVFVRIVDLRSKLNAMDIHLVDVMQDNHNQNMNEVEDIIEEYQLVRKKIHNEITKLEKIESIKFKKTILFGKYFKYINLENAQYQSLKYVTL